MRAGPGAGLPGQEPLRHRLQLRHPHQGRRRRLRLRRGDRPASPPWRASAACPRLKPPFPGAAGLLAEAHQHQQRGDLRQRALDHPPRRRGLCRHRHREEHRHQGLRPGGQDQEGRPGGGTHGPAHQATSSTASAAASRTTRRFKAVQMGGPSGGCIPADLAGHHRWTTSPSPRPAPSWAPAA